MGILLGLACIYIEIIHNENAFAIVSEPVHRIRNVANLVTVRQPNIDPMWRWRKIFANSALLEPRPCFETFMLFCRW